MNFVDTVNPNPLASRNAADITLSGITAAKVDITVALQSSGSISFAAEPYGGQLRIRLSDILRSFKVFAFQAPPVLSAGATAGATPRTVTITAAASGESSPEPWSRTVFEAGYKTTLHTALMTSYWWTWRDQVCRTFVDGKEYLGALASNSREAVRIVATFQNGTTSSVSLYGFERNSFGLIDVSYDKVSELFPGKTPISYKVYRGNSDYPQVYEVSQLKPRRTFVFRNSLGLFDTVYATGHISTGADRDVKTFIGEDREENISDNNSRERIYVNSGHIDTKGERMLWDEFVHSADAWEYEGGTFRKIVVDKFDSKLLEGASATLTFEYRYSAEPAGGGYAKEAI